MVDVTFMVEMSKCRRPVGFSENGTDKDFYTHLFPITAVWQLTVFKEEVLLERLPLHRCSESDI